jgi:hypothetical protein
MHYKLKKYADLWKEMATVTGVFVGSTVFCWNHFAIPEVKNQIIKETSPLDSTIKVLELKTGSMNYVMSKYIPQDSINKYTREYFQIIGKPVRRRGDR